MSRMIEQLKAYLHLCGGPVPDRPEEGYDYVTVEREGADMSQMDKALEKVGVMEEIFSPSGMSNFDHVIVDGFEEALKKRPNEVFGRHAGWNFNGMVWWDGENFNQLVWHCHIPLEVFTAPTLEELMEAVNKEWGWR